MSRLALALALAAPLALFGCKKKEPAPVADGPRLGVELGDVSFSGARDGGTWKLPVHIESYAEFPVQLSQLAVQVVVDDTAVCSHRQPLDLKLPVGGKQSVGVVLEDCAFRNPATIEGLVKWAGPNGEEHTRKFKSTTQVTP